MLCTRVGHVKGNMQKGGITHVKAGHTISSNSPGPRAETARGPGLKPFGVQGLRSPGSRTQLIGVKSSHCSGSGNQTARGRELKLLV